MDDGGSLFVVEDVWVGVLIVGVVCDGFGGRSGVVVEFGETELWLKVRAG